MTSAARHVAHVLRSSGLTKSALSARSGVSRALLDDYLKGRRQPSLAQLERLGTAAGLRLEVTWRPLDLRPTPRWARPNPAMEAPPLSIEERARALELVVAAAGAQQRQPPGELDVRPFRRLRESCAGTPP